MKSNCQSFETGIFMFEGKHLHFSPADNKPLCSYSNKLCRQRRLNGYAFCIRHILEDKSAPFKRCTYVTRNNNQICQNAIPTSQVSRGYCHSHMQVAGIIPKTERKVKNPPPPTKPVDSSNGSLKSVDSNSNSSNSNNSSNSSTGVGGVKKDPNAVFKFEDEEHSEIQWIPKGGRINGIVNGGKVTVSTTVSKGKDLLVSTSTKDTNGCVFNGRILNGNSSSEEAGKHLKNPFKKLDTKNGKLQNLTNGDTPVDKDSFKSRQTYGKKLTPSEKGKKEVTETGISSTFTSAINPSSSKGKGKQLPTQTIEESDAVPVISFQEKNTVETPLCIPEHGQFFDQLITLKSVEKSVSQSQLRKADNSSSSSSHANNKPSNSHTILRTIPTIPKTQPPNNQRFPQQKNSKIIKNSNSNCGSTPNNTNIESCISINNCSSASVDLFNSVGCAQKGLNSVLPFSSPDNIIGVRRKSKISQGESRQEFLARVRHELKSQYLTIKHTSNDSDKNEKIWKRALRNSLLTCVLKDVSYCAHVIVQNDPKKYSDPNGDEEVTIGKKSPGVEATAPACKPKKLNGTVVNHKNGKKNGLVFENDKHDLVNNFEGKGSLIKPGISLKKSVDKSPFSDSISKGKSKASKRTPTTDPNVKSPPVQSKKKARKSADLNSSSLIINGSISGSESSSSQSSARAPPSSHLIRRSISAKKSASDTSLDGGIQKMNAHKKRKFDLLNGSEHSLGPPSPFRVPKVEDSPHSHLSTDIDIKMENGGHGQMVFNNYNGHISSHSHHHHHPLLHPHSGSATTATLTNKASNLSNAHQVQLQALLSQPDLRSLATTSGNVNSKNGRNQGINTVLHSELGGNSDGVITDASFDSTFDHSVSSQQDCDFSDDDDLEKSLEFQIDPETEHQASRLLEDNELTEDDLNELFPETSNKIGRSADLSDLGVDFSSAFDANDIDYSLFANIFPFASRSSQSESISISNQY